ncbi:IclR family transcriptional regulator [Bordetella bronchiseptica]|nr:IclR family transcriptional regulator [Bordetella bronchiseptica]AUL14718.1 transcriptional regulator (iclr family) protein [Bordetella bronchiseptica]AWP57813.1 transcriptional regulator (iclr family) protein [Bordetella bronchiseptica]AWQ04546.1 transcriptional regulator (iclr family) protein [Bordetella bronchiseptica]AZW30108.1 IclR family transcriptional regulator [Bordetella bronchiseptica]KDC23132.1 transcriptional regulator, IclR family, C-terminal domain protein [Bordetella bronchi
MRSKLVKSATRVLDLLELLSTSPSALRVMEIAEEMDIPQSSASMLLATVEARGYIEREADGYRIARRFSEGGWVAGKLGVLLRAARPHMQALTEQTGESAFLGILTPAGDMQYVEKSVSQNPLRYDAELGKRAAYATTNGLVLLAALEEEELARYFDGRKFERLTPVTITDEAVLRQELERVRRQGYASLTDSHVVGASGSAFGIRDRQGVVVAALCIIAPTERFKQQAELVHALLPQVCNEIGRSLPD